MKLYLVRHGQTAHNAEKTFCGITDVPLDDLGRTQAAEVGSRLRDRVDLVFCSALSRSRETAEAIKGDPIVVEALHELDHGELEAMPLREVVDRYADLLRAWQNDAGAVRLPGGESFVECGERMGSAMADVVAQARASGCESAAVVGHQMAMAAFLCGVTATPLASWWRFRLKNGEHRSLRYDSGAFLLQQH